MRIRNFWNGLRGKITIQILVAVLLPLIVLAVISVFTLRDVFTDISGELDTARETATLEAGEALSARAFLIARRLDEYMIERVEDVAKLAQIPSFVQAAQRATAAAVSAGLPELNIDMLETLWRDQRRMNMDRNLQNYMNFLVETTTFSEIFFTEAHGFNVSFSNPTSDFVQHDEAWWQVAFATGIHIEEIAFDESAQTYVTAISIRIDDPETDEPLGVIKAGLDISRIQLLADEEADMLTNGSVLIFKLADGQRIADTAISHAPSLMLNADGALDGSSYPPAALAHDLSAGESSFTILQYTNTAEIVGFARTSGNNLYSQYGDFAGFNWVVAISQPETEILQVVNQLEGSQQRLAQQANNLVQTFTGIGVAAAVIGTILAAWQTRLIVNPISRLQQTALQLSRGELSARADVSSQDEVGDLAQAFNHMAQDLEQMVITERENNAYLENTIGKYMTFVEHVASGNLQMRLELNQQQISSDIRETLHQLGLNLNNMVASLAEMAGQIREVTTTVAASSTQIQSAIVQQTSSATEQDIVVAQVAATLEEVRQTVNQSAERARQVADASQHSIAVSNEGHQVVSDTVEGMEAIRQQVENIATTILALSEKTQQIGEIIETVNMIADQSKLLALNASIEAARAGEEGRGFAVVASEVRQLAEQSRDSTRRVSEILSEIQQATNTAVMVTEEGSKGVETGMALVSRAGEVIRNLSEMIEDAAQSATQIAASANQQTNGVSQLSTAMEQIRQATAQSAASAREVEQNIRNLVEMVNHLNETAARYEI